MSVAPVLLVRVELEELPVAIVLATSHEDERRLRMWLADPRTRSRVLEAVEDALDDVAERRAA